LVIIAIFSHLKNPAVYWHALQHGPFKTKKITKSSEFIDSYHCNNPSKNTLKGFFFYPKIEKLQTGFLQSSLLEGVEYFLNPGRLQHIHLYFFIQNLVL
jgi:hypothetical protein